MARDRAVFAIRKMIAADYGQVYRLWINTSGMGLNDVDDSQEGIAKYLDRNPSTCFVAVEGGKIIGAILSGHDGRRGYIHHSAVAIGRQNSGVGSALAQAALAALKKEGITKAALVIFSKNEAGNRFWQGRGFSARYDLIYRDIALAPLKRTDT